MALALTTVCCCFCPIEPCTSIQLAAVAKCICYGLFTADIGVYCNTKLGGELLYSTFVMPYVLTLKHKCCKAGTSKNKLSL